MILDAIRCVKKRSTDNGTSVLQVHKRSPIRLIMTIIVTCKFSFINEFMSSGLRVRRFNNGRAAGRACCNELLEKGLLEVHSTTPSPGPPLT